MVSGGQNFPGYYREGVLIVKISRATTERVLPYNVWLDTPRPLLHSPLDLHRLKS